MLPILPIAVLLLAPLAMFAIRMLKPGFAYQWLAAVLALVTAWGMLLIASLDLPIRQVLIRWQPEVLFSNSPTLSLDPVSWPFAQAVVTTALAVLLTAVVRIQPISWLAWSSTLALAGVGLLAVMAANPLTVLLAWAAMDLLEFSILLVLVNDSQIRERIAASFSARVGGIFLLIWAILVARTDAQVLTFENMPGQANIFVMMAAGLRLGILPLHLPFLQEPLFRRGLGTMLRLTTAASSLALLARAASSGLPENILLLFLVLVGIAGLYSAALWASAVDEMAGRPFWLLGMASLSALAALLSSPSASIAWSIALLLSGGLLSLASVRHRSLMPVFLIGLLGLSGLPFTPAWPGFHLEVSIFNPILLVVLGIHALLVAGFLKHMLRPETPLVSSERWVWIIYPAGLAILPLAHFMIGLRYLPPLAGISPFSWIAGLASVLIVAGLWLSRRRSVYHPRIAISYLSSFLSLGWFYRLLWRLYRGVGWMAHQITQVLEGEGGVLWALVLLAILFSLLSTSRLGG